MTKQQEFLDSLKNPTKACLKQAANEFYQNHRNLLYSVSVHEHYKNRYVIKMVADNADILYALEKIFDSTIVKYLENPMIYARTRVNTDPEEPSGFFKRMFYVMEL